MHLKSITLKGFKSFSERTRLDFSPGVSVIVGPNGCGKSNITDGVLWALGEQSPLAVRGQTMQDVIFAGGEGHGRRTAAEVEVVIDGTGEVSEFSELSIKRRLDRSGEGGYWLNGARCRLADVVEALADANLGREMHSVISQGRVEEIVHSRPRDRRLLIEEAAGLGKHRKRRRRAELKLRRTQENLDRALDVEREARTRLRPLKRQAQAAETHARLEREAMELRVVLLAEELRLHSAELGGLEAAAGEARARRDAVEGEMAAVNRRRTEIEERFAARDRERTVAWGRLTALRNAQERLSVRAEALATRRAELAATLERRRSTLGALVSEAREAAGSETLDTELGAVADALAGAAAALDRARSAGASGPQRAAEVSRVREGAERAARGARRAEAMLGRSRQDSLERRVAEEAALLEGLAALADAVAAARTATGERARALEKRVVGGERSADDIAEELRACSRQEAELQARLRAEGEEVTRAEVQAAHESDRRAEVEGELEQIAARLGRELGPAAEQLEDSEREEIERKLERLSRRRELLGPVNPLAEQEYRDALAHVEELETNRGDLEAALAELRKLIRETDRRIETAFEETFEAARSNFEELVEELFPGGRGRLRLVDAPAGPRPVLGGEEPAAAEGPDSAAEPVEPGEEELEEPRDERGVEIEVTPAGKATRRLTLLSGGEKSLVALAFVFSVFLARPSPFYILDEVEAALDDANIDRFLRLVRRFSDRAQFVIVTHQKRTMDAADVLYGVSMKEGVTKIISRRLPRDGAEPSLLTEAAERDEAEAA